MRAGAALVAGALITALGVMPAVGAPAQADAVERVVSNSFDAGDPNEAWDVDWDQLTHQPIPYVQADSPQEAIALLDDLESTDATARTAAAAAASFGPCVLYPSVIYFRTSSNLGALGFKPYTKCSSAVTSIHHESTLRYEYFGLWLVAQNKTGGNYGVASYTQRNIEYYCVGTIPTDFGGTTLGTVVYAGHTYYSRVYTERVEKDCTV